MNDKTTIDSPETVQSVDATIRNRVTRKVLATGETVPQLEAGAIEQLNQQVKQAVEVSGWAPFHYDRRHQGIAEPWRYTLLFHQACRLLAAEFEHVFDDIKPSNKIPKMLNACGALVLVTWLPENDSANAKIVQVNEEHLAAASAATQNLILALEARGLGTYWSSGGLLGSQTCFQRYSIVPESRLIAAVFVNYPGLYAEDSCEVIGGKNREKRSPSESWCQVIE